MAEKVSFLKSIIHYSISTWVNLILGIVVVPITTRLLAPDVYGMVAIFYSASSVALYAMTLGMDGAYIRFFNEPPANNTRQQLLYKILLLSLLFCAIVGCTVTAFWGEQFSGFVFGLGGKILTGLFFVYVFCQVILRYLNISFRMSFRVWNYNFQNILINCLSKILVIVAAVFTSDFIYIVLLLTIGIVMVLSVYAALQRKEFTPIDSTGGLNWSLSLRNYREFFLFSLFNAPTYIVHYAGQYINQQIIVSTLTAYSLGIYASAGIFSSILTTVRGGFSIFWTAYVYQNYDGDQKRIGKMHDFVVLFSIIAVAGLIMFRDVVYLLIDQEYHSSKAFFSLLLVGPLLAFISTTTKQGIAIAKKNHIELITDVFTVAFNMGVGLLLIPVFGLIGAAVVSLISGLVIFILNTYYGQKYYRTILNLKKSVIGLVLLLAITVFPSIVYNIKWIVLVEIILIAITCVIYKNEVHYVFGMVKSKMHMHRHN